MRLTSERLELGAGERFCALALVRGSKLAVATMGGFSHLRHSLEDTGLSDIELFEERPAAWAPRALPAVTPFEEWLLWFSATSPKADSLSRELTELLFVVDAWAATESAQGGLAPLRSVYAVTVGAPARLPTYVHAFGVAYPFEVLP
jgi:hypothetical protein